VTCGLGRSILLVGEVGRGEAFQRHTKLGTFGEATVGTFETVTNQRPTARI
jgi:hypothetical protein